MTSAHQAGRREGEGKVEEGGQDKEGPLKRGNLGLVHTFLAVRRLCCLKKQIVPLICCKRKASRLGERGLDSVLHNCIMPQIEDPQ